MAKYPGSFIINEYGTNKELAGIYGVSERTIYRWKQKAYKETGAKAKKPTRPRVSTLQKFKGTRKELAKKYGVSERTAYRWLADARQKGAEIPSRQNKAKYPGAWILNEVGSNKELADIYGVSERTIARWKRRARTETETEPEVISPNQPVDQKPEEPDFYDELYGNMPEPEPETEPEETPEFTKSYASQLDDITNMLSDYNLLVENSIFSDLPEDMKRIYIHKYIQFQWDENPYQFNQSPPDDPNGPDISDPDKIANINIWGADFETWLTNQLEIDNT